MTYLKSANCTLPSNQLGEGGIGGIVAIIILFALCIKLGVAIVPAQITDRQLDKAISQELKKANDNKESKKKLISSINSQLSINGYYDIDLAEMYTIEGALGNLTIEKEYEVENDFVPSVFITNKFKGKILPAGKE